MAVSGVRLCGSHSLSRCALARTLLILSMAAAIVCDSSSARAGQTDWPTHRRSPQRNAYLAAEVDTPRLALAWQHDTHQRPQPAWYGPAKWDAYSNLRGLHSMRNYDPVFHTVSSEGSVYFGSSTDHAVTCLDAATGQRKWSFMTDGPVRIAPTMTSNGVLAVSGDCAFVTGRVRLAVAPILATSGSPTRRPADTLVSGDRRLRVQETHVRLRVSARCRDRGMGAGSL